MVGTLAGVGGEWYSLGVTSLGIAIGLTAGVLWGIADFLARLSTEKIGTLRTVFYMQLASLAAVAPALLVPSLQPSWPSSSMVLLAMGIGVFNACGALLLYRALETGVVSLVSPVSSTFSVVAAALAIATGERPSLLQWAGLALTVVGVIAVSLQPGNHASVPASQKAIALSAGAALLWGISFFGLKLVVRDLGPVFPVLISRGIAAALVAALARGRGESLARPPRAALGLVVGVAVFDTGAFIAYNVGVSVALTSVVAVLASLYSVVTMILAGYFLKERLNGRQWASVVVVLTGVGLVSAS